MKIPEDKTPPEIIKRAKSLFGVTFTDYMGTEHTAFDYLHGQVFQVRDKCRVHEYNGTVIAWDAESYIKMYDSYLDRIRVKKENNAEQFNKDNGTVAMIKIGKRNYKDPEIFDSTSITTLTKSVSGSTLSGIFKAMFFGKGINIGYEYRDTPHSQGVKFLFNKHINENYWTLERDSTTESGYESTCRDQEWTGINKFNHRHLTVKTVDDVFNKAVDDVFDVIRKNYCTGTKIGVNKAGTKFMLPTKHVCVFSTPGAPTDDTGECQFTITFCHMHSDTRYTRHHGNTLAIPKIAKYITNDEFITELRVAFEKYARPLYEFTKTNMNLK